MKALTLLLLLTLAALPGASGAEGKPSAPDLVGKWDGLVEFGKFKFKIILRIAKTPASRLAVTMDNPDQGQKDMPVAALLYNHPDLRLEIDQFGTSYTGTLDDKLTQITGAFDEGPGGRPIPLSFKRSTEPDAPEAKKVFTFAKGEPTDIRGYWKGSMTVGPGMSMLVGLSIGRVADGSFQATMDLPEQGAKGIPAASVTTTNRAAVLKWQAFQSSLDAKLSEDGNSLAGEWSQGGRTNAVTFQRLDAPLSLVPKDVSFEPDNGAPDDPRGSWKGTLEVPGAKLRLIFKIGRAPDGAWVATLSSIDQGGGEIPASSATFASPKVKMEWKGIRGKFEGDISKDGATIEGKWEQFGNPAPLKIERVKASEQEKKP